MDELKLNDWVYVLDYIYREINIECNSKVRSCLQISKSLDITSSHALTIISILESKNLIERSKEGREMNIFLTKKGRELGERVHYIVTSINSK